MKPCRGQWIDERHFAELASAEPDRLCAGGRASYDPATGRYSIRIWNDDYTLDGKNRLVQLAQTDSQGTTKEANWFFTVFVIWYLLDPAAITQSNIWVSEKDFPGGETFFRGPHQIPTAEVSTACGEDLARFTAACLHHGGEPVAMGDAAFRFVITPDIAVTMVYWLGDEDFPAEAKLLFDQGMIGKLPLDMVFCLAVEVCQRLGRTASKGT